MDLLTLIFFFAGFVMLVYGAKWLVDGASSIASRYRISHMVIGMTIVALGTSSPELVVNLIASYKGTADVAIGNVLGSNVSNLFLILGISAVIFPLAVSKYSMAREVPFALLGALVIGVLANDLMIDRVAGSMLYRSDGLILILFFLVFMVYAFGAARKGLSPLPSEVKYVSAWFSVSMIIAGIVFLILGGRWIVQGAVEIAVWLGMSEAVISLTIVALGTSLPELAACVAAAMKRNAGIVMGNVLGSNIFNIFFVLGASAVVKPLPFNKALNFDVLTGIVAALLLLIFLLFSRGHKLQRWHGVLFLFLYASYVVYLLVRG